MMIADGVFVARLMAIALSWIAKPVYLKGFQPGKTGCRVSLDEQGNPVKTL